MKLWFLPACISALFFLSACSVLTKKPSVTEKLHKPSGEAESLLSVIQNKNYPKAFKGIGKITLQNRDLYHTVRVAWIGSGQKKLRIEVLSTSGQPAESIAYDGRYIYYVSHFDNKYYKKKVSDATVEKIIGIPVKFCDIIALLAGRVPVYDHFSAKLIKDESNEGFIIVLKKKLDGVIEKIFLDKTKRIVKKIEIYNLWGSLVYRASFKKMLNVNGYQIPKKIAISNDDAEIWIVICKYWTDINPLPSLFELKPILIE